MNYIVIFSFIIMLFYTMYIYHETYQSHYFSEMSCVTKYGLSGMLCCFLIILVPARFYMYLFIGMLIIFPIFMYYKEEGAAGQLISYYVLLFLSAFIYFVLRYFFSILPDVMLPIEFMVDNLFCNFFCIVLLFYLQHKHDLHHAPYVIIVILLLIIACVIDFIIMRNMELAIDHLLWLLPNGLTICAIGIFRLFYAMEASKDNVLDLTIQRYTNKENKDRYEELEKQNQIILQQMHDMKKHLQMLESMENQEEAFASYKKAIEEKANDILYHHITGNTMIDRVLQTYQIKMQHAHIQSNIEVDDIDFSFIDIIDLSALLANMLDNAIESCLKCDERVLLLKIKKQKNFVVFKMKNSCRSIVEENGELKTSKQDHLFHGYGMQNMRFIAHSYQGEVKYRFDEEHQLFITTIPLFINQ